MANFDEAVSVLMFSQPFYASLLMKMEHVEDDQLSPATLCVNRRQVRYHPAFMAQLTLDEAVFCVAHEVQHLAWMHLPRIEHYLRSNIGPDGKPLDMQLFNMALDYPINDMLQRANIGAVPRKDLIQICLDKKYGEDRVPEDIYCELRKEQDKNGGGGAGSPGNGQQALDGHDALSYIDDPDAITPADIMQAVNQHKAIKGNLPAGMERMLGELKKPATSPWAVLRRFTVASLPGADGSTWRRLQRRMIVRGVGMPGRQMLGAGHVGIVIDTSGSIGQEMLDLFGGHMAAIIDDARPLDVRLYWTDAKVHRVDVAKNASELRQILSKKVPGGGGTDMPKGVRAAEQDKCNAIIVLTDGYTGFCDSDRPLMWAITTHNVTASGNGTTIHI